MVAWNMHVRGRELRGMRLRQGHRSRTANYLRTQARIQRYAGMKRHMWEHF
jgi:hypothetical protein